MIYHSPGVGPGGALGCTAGLLAVGGAGFGLGAVVTGVSGLLGGFGGAVGFTDLGGAVGFTDLGGAVGFTGLGGVGAGATGEGGAGAGFNGATGFTVDLGGGYVGGG